MADEKPAPNEDVQAVDIAQLWQWTQCPKQVDDENIPETGWSYERKLGRETIRLDAVEFRILMFLAAHPYRAFSRRSIAAAVSTAGLPVPEETLDRYIASLRDQLGFFRDYIQTVPYIGYRFKA